MSPPLTSLTEYCAHITVDCLPPAERQYIKQVQETIRKDAKPPVSFLQALRIDLSRLLLGLSAAQRDLILLRCVSGELLAEF